jgi:predicted metal-dependent enzyme (double-stranded beta helix superfamily)/rhodanese-related sulfurtransferase
MSETRQLELPQRLQQFISALDGIVEKSEPEIVEQGSALLRELLRHDDWLPPQAAAPHPQFYRQYLLYRDPAARFSVLSFVWGPGQSTPIHDHTVWGLIGLLRGAEISQGFHRRADGTLAPDGEPQRLESGTVAAVSPSLGDIHQVHNAYSDRVSIGIHVYGADIGAVDRSVYTLDGQVKPFRSGYAPQFPHRSYQQVRAELLAGREIALLDVREEDPHAQAHPLFAANFPYGRIELDAYAKLPRRDVPIVVLDDGEGLALPSALRLHQLGYTDVALLEGGVAGWRDAGGELFRDVNVPSKSFGELVEHERHTPSLPAPEVQALIDNGADIVILDARRYDEYHTMSIPGSISVPGAELALRARELAPDPSTRIIVNCAGRTRSIIGTQSLINAGVPNPVAALRNGTIGWTLARQQLEHGQSRSYPPASEANRQAAARDARALADRAGVARVERGQLKGLHADRTRSYYFFDVRSPGEYGDGRLPHFRSAPGGQLVQETEQFAPVRGARIVLADSDGVRANLTAHWLRQMNHDVCVVDGLRAQDFSVSGAWQDELPPPPQAEEVDVATLSQWLAAADGAQRTAVLDLSSGLNYQKRHIPGAWFALRSQLAAALAQLPSPAGRERYVLTCGSGLLARYAAADLRALTALPVLVLAGGTTAWASAGQPLESGATRLASPLIDRYRRPYEGTDNRAEAMQAYLDWEFGLVAQLARDATHGFHVI